MSAFARMLLAVALLAGISPAVHAGPDCTAPPDQRKSTEPMVDWYDNYIRPYRSLPGNAGEARLGKSQVEAFIEEIRPFHRGAVLDPLYFEVFAQLISDGYQGSAGFKGIDAAAAEKIYNAATRQRLDFSLLCINARTVRTPDDAFAITLFGVPIDDCQHIGLRGLVFTEILVNGSTSGQCRPDQPYFRLFALPQAAGTNFITFVCRKSQGGCVRQ
jgi:hypothetical protein